VADVALKPVDGEVQAAPSQCPLLGVKRTSACALHMSAFDPKRTLGGSKQQAAWPEGRLLRSFPICRTHIGSAPIYNKNGRPVCGIRMGNEYSSE